MLERMAVCRVHAVREILSQANELIPHEINVGATHINADVMCMGYY